MESMESVDGATATAHDDLQKAIQGLKRGETYQLNTSDVQLNATLLVDATEVTIRGSTGGTKIRCPPDGGALDIR